MISHVQVTRGAFFSLVLIQLQACAKLSGNILMQSYVPVAFVATCSYFALGRDLFCPFAMLPQLPPCHALIPSPLSACNSTNIGCRLPDTCGRHKYLSLLSG